MPEETTAAEGPTTFRHNSGQSLRQRAEDVLQKRPEEMKEIPVGDIQDLIHELQVHQVELEMQNEELRQAQQALERARDRYSDLYEFAPVGYFTLNRKGTILEANLTLAMLLGVERGCLIERRLSRFIVSEDQEVYYHHRRRLFEARQPQSCELRMVRGDGSRVWVLIEARAALDSAGQTVCWASVSDVTARKRAEENLRETTRRFYALLDHSPALIHIFDEEGRYLLVGRATAEAIGLPREEIIGKTFADLLPPEMVATFMRRVEALKEDRAVLFVEDQIPVNGEERFFESLLFPLSDEAGMSTYAAIATDITARKRAEEALKRSNEKLEQFAYVISHDLQEPARMVKSYMNLLARRYQGQLDEKADLYIDYAVDGAERMQEMINAILDLSRIGTRGQEPAPTDAEAVLARTLRSLGTAIEAAEAEVTHDPLPTVMADPAQLAQVFQNLIANALKFRREGVTPHVHISAEREGDAWRFSIRDNGIGIDPKQAGRIFRIFQRLHTEEEYPGLGIGLALCKRIVERHGGCIWVESEPGAGATFTFTLPVRQGERDGPS